MTDYVGADPKNWGSTPGTEQPKPPSNQGGGLYVGADPANWQTAPSNQPVSRDIGQKYETSYWENPANVGLFYNILSNSQSKPDWVTPEFEDFLEQAYATFEVYNNGATWDQWQPLPFDDPNRQLLQSFAPPPLEFQFPGDKPVAPVEANPNYTTGGLTQEEWDALPWIQKMLYSVFSSPKTSGAAIGASAAGISGIASGAAQGLVTGAATGGPVGAAIGGATGALTGGAVGGLSGAGLGASLGALGNKYPWLTKVFDALDYPAEGVERFLGAVSLLSGGDVRTFDDLSAAWKAGHVFYDVARFKDEQMISMLQQPVKVDWTDEELIYETYQRIRAGENPEDVYLSIQERTGDAGMFRDLMGHMIFDPLNFAGIIFAKAGKGLVKGMGALGVLSDNKALQKVLAAGAEGPLDLAKKYTTELRMNTPISEVANYDGLSKWMAGLTKEGLVKDLQKPQALTGVAKAADRLGGAAITGGLGAAVGGGLLGGPGGVILGLLGGGYGMKKGFSYLTHLTPVSKALAFGDIVSGNITTVMSHAGDDIGTQIHWLKGLAEANTDMLSQVGKNMFDAPEAAATPLAIKAAIPNIEKNFAVYNATEVPRTILNNVAEVLGKSTQQLLDEIGDTGKRVKGKPVKPADLDVVFRQVQDAARETNNQVLLDSIADGSLTKDSLRDLMKSFIQEGIAYNDDMFKAQMYAQLMDSTAQWTKSWFDVQPEPMLIRMSQALKNAQSLVLLGLNPNYVFNNVINNTVTMLADGTFGLRNQEQIGNFWKRMGVEPARLRQGVTALDDVRAKSNSILTEATKVGDAVDKFGDATGRLTDKWGILGNISRKAESWASAQGFTTSTYKAWNKLWKEGVGFDAMKPDVRNLLGEDLARYVTDKIQSGMNKAEIEDAIWNGYQTRMLDDLVPDLARNAGMNENALRELLGGELNISEFLGGRLKGDPDTATINKAFSDLINHVEDTLDRQHTQWLQGEMEKYANKLQGEGGISLVDMYGQEVINRQMTELAHWQRMAQFWDELNTLGLDSTQRRFVVEDAMKKERMAFEKFNKRSEMEYREMARIVGQDTEAARGITEVHKQKNAMWADFFKKRDKMYRDLYKGNDFPTREMFDRVEAQVAQMYDVAINNERNMELALNGLFTEMVGAQFGDAGRQAAEQWRAGMITLLDDMRSGMREFRESIKGLYYKDRRDAWKAFVPEHQKKIVDFYNQNKRGADDLYRQLSGIDANPDADGAIGAVPMGFIDGLDVTPNAFTGLDEVWNEQLYSIIEDARRMMLSDEGKYANTVKNANLSPEALNALKQYLGQVYAQMGDTKNVAIKHGEMGRDMALLNYNRRYGIDSITTAIMPYQFWYTRSAINWAMRAVDRPGWLAQWARIRSMQQETEKMKGFPSRLEGKFQFKLPFLPEWMGNTMFADPLRQMFPHELLMEPFQRMAQENTLTDSRARYILEQWAADEKYSQAQLQEALDNRAGDIWNKAVAQAKIEIEADYNNPMDFIQAISGPLLPIGWLYNAVQGKKEKIGELPVTRAIQALTSWATPGGINIEAPLRKALGLPVGGEYMDYYIDRELTNLALSGDFTVDEVMRAMVDRTGEAFTIATDRVGKKQSIRYFTSSFAMDFFPEGEQEIRALREEYSAAIDAGTVAEFFEKHPEYNARLMEFQDTPEDKLRKFTISAIWDAREKLPDLIRKQIDSRLGDEWSNSFLNKETRSYDSIDTETLVTWAKLMNASLPETANQYETATPELGLASPQEAQIYQWYNDQRDVLFGEDIFNIQNRYYALPEGSKQRKDYLSIHPELVQYWSWNRGVQQQYPIIAELKASTKSEIQPEFVVDINDFNPVLTRIMLGYFEAGQPLGSGARSELYRIYVKYGKPTNTLDEFIELLRSYIYNQ